MKKYVKKSEYLIKKRDSGYLIEAREKKGQGSVSVNFLNKKGARELFERIYKNSVSPCHLRDVAMDFLEESLK